VKRLKPLKPLRRFDVFAEYRMLDAREHGMPADQARGYALWVAKVVASRTRRRKRGEAESDDAPSAAEGERRRRRKWRVLSGVRQTDKLFEHEIVDRMGADFYAEVFAPAVEKARASGQSYEDIRDRLRRRWKAAPTLA
jgi:hypothetical protein